jgi:hypothetical protein
MQSKQRLTGQWWMVCGSLNEIDQGGGGDIQPLSGSAMAPRKSYHNEKLDICSLLNWVSICDFESRDWNGQVQVLLSLWDAERRSGWRCSKYLPEDCKNLRAKLLLTSRRKLEVAN